MSIKTIFWLSLTVTTLMRVVLAYFLPLTGDEVYYATWGLRELKFGYYDHPPAVALAFALSFLLGNNFLTVRLFGILIPGLLSLLVFYFISKEKNKNEAYLWASVILWIPLITFGIVITPDTIFLPALFLSFIFFWKSQREKKISLSVVSGLFLGVALLSKLLVLPYLICLFLSLLVVSKKSRLQYATYLFVKLLSSLPFLAVLLTWNTYNCWPNFMLNVVNRHSNGQWGFWHPFEFLLFQGVIFTPVLFYFFIKDRNLIFNRFATLKQAHWALVLGIGPIISFFISALRFPSSLHWTLPYNVICIALLGIFISQSSAKKILLWLSCLTSSIFIIATFLLSNADFWIAKHHKGETLEIFFHREQIVDLVKPYFDSGFTLATDSYTLSALFEYESHKQNWPTQVAVMDNSSVFGREDDLATNYEILDGKNIALFTRGEIDQQKYSKFFDEIKVHKYDIKNWDYFITEGRGFKFQVYREEILAKIIEKFYNFPHYLPVQGCPFIERHFHSPQI